MEFSEVLLKICKVVLKFLNLGLFEVPFMAGLRETGTDAIFL